MIMVLEKFPPKYPIVPNTVYKVDITFPSQRLLTSYLGGWRPEIIPETPLHSVKKCIMGIAILYFETPTFCEEVNHRYCNIALFSGAILDISLDWVTPVNNPRN